MKASWFRIGLVVAALTPSMADALEVHEWGTFTTVLGSDGRQVHWWSPTLEGPAELPEFVTGGGPIVLSKPGQWSVRMETPVLYFYPDEAMDVKVSVDDSRIGTTEAFPHPGRGVHGVAVRPPLFAGMSASPRWKTWEVALRPPGDEVGAMMPEVGQRGSHYAHAREVPEAWWVLSEAVGLDPQVEKFIFYRGAGSVAMPQRVVRVAERSVRMKQGPKPAFLVEVGEGELRWLPCPVGDDPELETDLGFPSISTEAHVGMESLVAVLVEELIRSGLSDAEARAMVATWEEAWLEEPGLRVLEILPREWVDQVLPLQIEPSPRVVERVFVARWELLSSATEDAVIAVIDGGGTESEQAEELEALKLGRFVRSALERAAEVRDQRFRSRGQALAWLLNPPRVPDHN